MNTSRNLHKWRSNAARYPGLFRVLARIPREWIAGFMALAAVLVGSNAVLGQGATPPGPLDQWTNASSGTTNWLGAVAASPSTIVAVGASGTVVTSTNGVDWSPQFSGVAENLNTIVYGNGMFLAGGDAGTIITSADGVAWTSQRSNTTDAIYGLAYANGSFVGVGTVGLILTSADGFNWARQQTSVTNDLANVVFGNGTYAAIERGTYNWFGTVRPTPKGSISILSTNGIDWSNPQYIWTDTDSLSLVFGDGYFFTVGTGEYEDAGLYPGFATSTDGIHWGEFGGLPASSYYDDWSAFGIAAGVGHGQFLTAVVTAWGDCALQSAEREATLPLFNADLPNSTENPFGFHKLLPDILYSIGFWRSRFVAVGDSGAIYLSGTLPPYLSQVSQSGNMTTVSMEGIPLESYVLQSAAIVNGPWQAVSTNTTSADGKLTFTDPTPPDGGSRFYRVSGP